MKTKTKTKVKAARARTRVRTFEDLTPKQLVIAVERLIKSGALRGAEVVAAFIEALEETREQAYALFADLDLDMHPTGESVGGKSKIVGESKGKSKSKVGGTTPRVPKARVPHKAASKSPKPSNAKEREVTRQLQGQYLGLIRHVPKSQRGQFKALIASKGKQAAINAIREYKYLKSA